MSKVGFIGLGTIGGPMAERLLLAGHKISVFDVNADACISFRDRGGLISGNCEEMASTCDTIFLSLPGPPQIEDVILGGDGLLTNNGSLHTIIDLSTNSLQLNRTIAARAQEENIAYLDAPVSGGKIAAKKGTLSVMVGGDENSYNSSKPLIECFAEHIFYMGQSGTGTLTKLVNNQIFLAASVLIQEGFVMGAKAGMDPNALLEVLKVSSAGSLLERAPLILSKKFDLNVFALSIAEKDLTVALQSASDIGASMPMTEASREIYRKASAKGLGKEDFFATVKVLEEIAECSLHELKKPNP